MVRNQNGMLTLDAPVASANVTAFHFGHSRTYGRWEARVRGRQYGSAARPTPSAGSSSAHSQPTTAAPVTWCSAPYPLGTNTAATHVRTLPNNDFTASKPLQLSDNEFHTYAVEVTPDHVSWFVDTKVIRTETRRRRCRRAVHATLPARESRGPDEQGPDADGLDALLHARPQEREVDRRAGAHPDDVRRSLLTVTAAESRSRGRMLRVRIATFNMLNGRSPDDEGVDVDRFDGPSPRSTPTCSHSRRSTATSRGRAASTSPHSPPRRWARWTTGSSPR